MKFTSEQEAIIDSSGSIKINAVAGSGKTTTVIEYARTRPLSSKILYLAFNRTVKLEAAKKFAEQGRRNVRIETAHSLAYQYIVRRNGYKVNARGYKTHEITELLGLQGNGERHTEYVIANHINKFVSYFCNSRVSRVKDLNYLKTVADPKANTFVSTFYPYIERQVRVLLSKMDSGEIEVTHDFYLKKFQLSKPVLPYDYILFDEGQDASEAMLDVFSRQKATKIIVGDTHQQIYGWRYAVNSLEKTDFKTYQLSTSFRFGQDLANLASAILSWKKHLKADTPDKITGLGKTEKVATKAVIGRTNLGLLLKAIEYVTEKKQVKSIYFEGNINSYTYANEGASLYDVLNLQNGKKGRIRDQLIRKMSDIKDLEAYIDKAQDVQLSMMVEIVKEYGNEIPKIIRQIKNKHIEGDEKAEAEMIFSTVHRCKGMEYDTVQLVNDFITEERVEQLAKQNADDALAFAKINEEINLLYVAATRTKATVYIPETLLPKDFPDSPNIRVMRVKKEEEESKTTPAPSVEAKKAPSYMEKVKKTHKQAYQPWTPELDEELKALYEEGITTSDLSRHFGQTKGAIRSRVKKLGIYYDPFFVQGSKKA